MSFVKAVEKGLIQEEIECFTIFPREIGKICEMRCAECCFEKQERLKQLKQDNFLFSAEDELSWEKINYEESKFELHHGKYLVCTLVLENEEVKQTINTTIFELEINKNELRATKLGKVSGSIKCFIEGEDCLYLAIDKRVEKIQNSQSTVLFETKTEIQDMQLRDKHLRVIDWCGVAQQFNLVNKEIDLTVSFDSYGNHFIIEDSIILITLKKILVTDWKRNESMEIKNRDAKPLKKIYSDKTETVLKGRKRVCVFDHALMKSEDYIKSVLKPEFQ